MKNGNLFYALRYRPFAVDAEEAGMVTLMGMVAIFAVLALLWLFIELLHCALTKKPKESESSNEAIPETKKEAVVPNAVPTPVAEPAASVAADDGALIAAITAAISAAMSEEGYTGGFRVVSFKRASARKSGRC